MNNIDILEFNKIRDVLSSLSKIEINKQKFNELSMSNNKDEVELSLKRVNEFAGILVRAGNFEFVEIGDIASSVNRASKGSVLTIGELYNILVSFRLIKELSTYSINLSREEFKEYYSILDDLTFVDILFNELNKSIGDDYTILDSASLKLKKIRSEIRNSEAEITNKLKRIISQNSKILADQNIVYRNNKQLLAVISSYKYSLGGVIVDTSASGATVYIEPEEVYKLTSRINLLKEEEKEEIERILIYLSQYVVSYKSEILNNFYALLELDYIFAKAKYGNKINGKIATIGDKVRLIDARHPLIDSNKVVSNNFIFEKEKIMVISGPNTGGKSVALKTLGLLAYMNQCGLLISVDKEAVLPIFDNIYLDMGDNQSISESLSTFSGHITNIASILDSVTQNSLVLLDEVGAGTDPKEGEALATSLVEEFHDRNTYLMITTHYDNLKSYALEKDYINICAMDFDKKTLKPTYKLLENRVGTSYGLEIARSYGLADSIIERAFTLKESFSNSSEKMMEKLKEEIVKYEALSENLEKEKRVLEEEVEITKEKNHNLEMMVNDIRENALSEKETLVNEALEEIEKILDEVKNKDNLKLHEVLNAKKALEELEIKREEERSNAVFNVGDYVYVNSLSLFGTITKKNKDIYSVNVGNMSVNVSNKDLELREKKKEKNKVVVSSKVKSKSIRNELNLIGKTSSEALYELEKFIDNARVINLSPVRVIHGFGKGILRETVHNYLKKCDFVDSYTLAGYGEGGGGATIVYLKKRNEQ